MNRKRFIKIAIAGALAGITLSGAVQAQERFRWRLQTNLNTGEPGHVSIEEKFAGFANRLSGGRLTIQVFPVGALFPIQDGLEAVATGLTEMAVLTGGYYAGKIGSFANLETGVPGSLRTPIERHNFFYKKGFLQLTREAFAKHGVFYLGPHISPRWDMMSKTPITSMADFKGLKVRSFGLEAKWYEKMGASPVFLSGGEIYTALATGVIGAARWGSPSVNFKTSFHEVAKFYVDPSPMPVPNNFFAVNPAAWNKLPADLKAILEEAAVAASLEYMALADLQDSAAMQRMEKAGVKISRIPPEEFAKMEAVARGLWSDYAKEGGYAAQGVKMLNDYLTELGR